MLTQFSLTFCHPFLFMKGNELFHAGLLKKILLGGLICNTIYKMVICGAKHCHVQ